MASPDLVNLNMFIQKGKPFPKKLDKKGTKGIVTTESLAGYSKYTARDDATKPIQSEADISPGGYFKYASERVGATRTYTNEGWKDNPEELKEFRNFVAKHFLDDGEIAWLPVQSFKDYMTASQYGLFKDEDYASVIEKTLDSFFPKVGFEKSNMIWYMNYHTNKDHPHVHLVFLEKEKTRTKGMFTQEELKFFKRELLSNMLQRERTLNNTLNKFNEQMKDVDHLKKNLVVLGKQAFNEMKSVEIDEDILKLYKELPTSGRLQYGSSQMIPYREQIDKIVDRVLDHKTVKPELDKCLEEWKKLDDVYASKLNEETTNIVDSELAKIRKQIANEILRGAKDFDNHLDAENQTENSVSKFAHENREDEPNAKYENGTWSNWDWNAKQDSNLKPSYSEHHLAKALGNIKRSASKAKRQTDKARDEYLKDGEKNQEVAGLDI